MRAAVFHGPKDIRIEEVPTPECGDDEVLIKVKRAGTCGTDLHIYTGGFKIPTPQVIGHEFVGEVAAVGSGVRGIEVGEHVTAEHVIPCKKCRYCNGGEPNFCLKMTVIGVHLPGGMAEYVKVPAELVYKLPEKFTFDEGVLVEPLSISVYAVRNSGLKVGDTVAVIGLGPIGLFIAAAAKASGATVIGVDRNDARLEYARRAGFADHTVNSTDGDVESRIVEIAGG
jgi:threonine dehydrogenase-like Zn-dependent dehydrogenase